MPKSYKDILPILKEIKKDIAKILNTKEFELIVFGSYAREEAREDSDLDLLLLTKEKVDFKKEIEILKILNKKFNYELLFHLIVKQKNEFDENYMNPFLIENIKKEGIKI